MLYLSTADVDRLFQGWPPFLDAIESTLRTMRRGDFAQPLKPYLRYRDPANRIIAMPAFVGGDCDAAGLKWIASFPENPERGLARAHCVVLLNDADTGEPIGCINSPRTSTIRTAAVSGVVLRHFIEARGATGLDVGLTGFGPIGQAHASMLLQAFPQQVESLRVFDVRDVDPRSAGCLDARVRTVPTWQDAYDGAHVFITCTTTRQRYVDRPPRPGALLLNVSLRDFVPSIHAHVHRFVVDDWSEVCREDTDVELMAREFGLGPGDVETLVDVAVDGSLRDLRPEEVVMVNPMGMACFDVAVAKLLLDEAVRSGVGTTLP